MDATYSTNRKLQRMFANILSIFAVLAIAFPAMGSVSAQEPVFLESSHDGTSGEVNASGCDANGWAVDLDDRFRDVQIQVFSDGVFVGETVADIPRGLPDALCPDGGCGFYVSLWGLIEPGVPHEIRVKAYDPESDQWLDLGGTPKSLTCWGHPEGFHDGNEGMVDPNSCTAFGWAVDPDDRDRDTQVRILSDDVEIAAIPASDYGEDMDQLGICPGGTCRFTVNLWGLISPDEEHQILLQAYDEESGEWWNLESTPKSLTCFTPSPHFTVFPEWEFFDGLDWPDGATVTITVEGKPDCETSKESWGYFFNGNFGEGCDVVAGDVVTFTFGDTIRTHTVQNLAVTDVAVVANTVGGVADSEAVIQVWPHETGQQLQVTAEDGAWQVDFTGMFDLVKGTCGRSQILVGDNATAVDWCAPKPWLIAFPENDAVEAWEWPAGEAVTLTIDNAPSDFTRTGIAEVTTWGDPRTYLRFDFADAYNLQIGDVVTLTGGNGITRSHTVLNLSVNDVNADTDTVSGTATADALVQVWPHGHDQAATMQITAGADGSWSANFADVGFNLVPGIGGRSEVGDEAGNWTAVDWGVPMDGWQQVNDSGFGDPQNVSVSALEVFKGQLYAGVSNWDSGGQVWRLGTDGHWLQVVEPGFDAGPANPAIIDLAVFQGKLYAGVGWNEAPGQVWRSADGTNWQPVTTDGFGDGGNTAITNFVVFKGMLYAGTNSTSGSGQIWRSSTGNSGSWTQVAFNGLEFTGQITGFAVYKGMLYATNGDQPLQVWRSANGIDWVTITVDGFGDERNWAGGFAQFGGYLYLGTTNDDTGAQLWRTMDGMNWEQVMGDGFGDLNNRKIESLFVYDDLLYAVTFNGPMGLQIWRSADGISWEQVVANGFGDSNNFATLWINATAEFQGQILIGTWNYAEGGELWMFTS